MIPLLELEETLTRGVSVIGSSSQVSQIEATGRERRRAHLKNSPLSWTKQQGDAAAVAGHDDV